MCVLNEYLRCLLLTAQMSKEVATMANINSVPTTVIAGSNILLIPVIMMLVFVIYKCKYDNLLIFKYH